MKKINFVLPLLGLLGVGVVLALTNPKQSAYEKYAASKLKTYLNDNVCEDAGFLQDQCNSLLETTGSPVEQIVASSTQRQNFGVFSIYQTKLSTPLPFSPSYQIETFGVLNTFHTYKSETLK